MIFNTDEYFPAVFRVKAKSNLNISALLLDLVHGASGPVPRGPVDPSSSTVVEEVVE